MKKTLVSILAILLAFVIVPNTVFAAPAAPLTDIQILGVTSDGANYVWEEISRNQSVANIPLTGTKGYLAVLIYGSYLERNPLLYNNGVRISTTNPIPSDWVTDSRGNVIGEIVYLEFDLANVTTGRFTVSATDYYPPNQTRYDHLYIYVQ